MDLIAPNPAVMSTGFIQLGIIVVSLLVAAITQNKSTHGPLLWMKMNRPLVSIAIGEAWALTGFALFKASPAIDDYFVVGVWLAGGSSLIAGLLKDARDGSMAATDEMDVRKMRASDHSKRGGIGS